MVIYLSFVIGHLSFVPFALAQPIYAVRTGMHCSVCHVSPTGGGIRTQAGFTYGQRKLSFEGAETLKGVTIEIDPAITKSIRVGGNVRYRYDRENRGANAIETQQLESQDLYVAAELTSNLRVVAPLGQGGRGDTYFMFQNVLEDDTNLRVGRITPPFGWHIPDDTSLIRNPLGLGFTNKRVGVEVSRITAGQFSHFFAGDNLLSANAGLLRFPVILGASVLQVTSATGAARWGALYGGWYNSGSSILFQGNFNRSSSLGIYIEAASRVNRNWETRFTYESLSERRRTTISALFYSLPFTSWELGYRFLTNDPNGTQGALTSAIHVFF